jgi:tRNA threonylcarbamoyladenosine biosynthesis protein TsaB
MLLAVDTSTRTIGVAIYDGVNILCESIWNSRDYHTVELAPAVDDALLRADVKMEDLQALAVATGPGSFTGLRIGMALAKGIALARRLPIIGVPTLDILAWAQPMYGFPLVAILQAGRGRLAVGWYETQGEEPYRQATWRLSKPVEILDIHRLAHHIQRPTLVCGELTDDERRVLGRKHKNVLLASPAQSLRRPSFLAEIAWKRWQSGQVDDPATLSPFYVHVGEPIPG